jgi:hypothetical protein
VDGHYFLIEYQAEGDAVAEVERTLRITDGVLRYISVQQEHTGLPQPRQREASRREDVPLSEMRSYGNEPAAVEEGAAGGETTDEQPSEQTEQAERGEQSSE